MDEIRICTPDDVPAVAALYQRTFRSPRQAAPPALMDCLHRMIFEHPDRDPDFASRVHVGRSGAVNGFIGVLPVPMAFRGRAVRAATPTSIMVDTAEADGFAGARLMRSFLAGPQEISIAEPANPIAAGLWEALGGECVLAESMEWLKVLRPAGLALALAGQRKPLMMRVGRPPTAMIDRLTARLHRRLTRVADVPTGSTSRDLDDGEVGPLLRDLAGDYALSPDWSPEALAWMLGEAGRNQTRGPLHRRAVFDRRGRLAGVYLHQARRGDLAWVLHVATRSDSAGLVLDSLFSHAAEIGCVAVKGRTQSRLVAGVLERNCVLFRRHSALVHSRNAALLDAVRSGNAVTGGLVGESWMRLVADYF